MITTDHDDGALPVLFEKVDVKAQQRNDVVGDDLKEDAVGSVEAHSEDDKVVYLNGEPVITTGRDVSRFLVDVRDDGETALTFRSLFLGTVMAGLGASLYQQHVVSTFVASTAAYGSTAVLNFAVQRLYYNTHVEVLTAVLATFSTACFGYGLTGLLQPLTVYPSEMVYWKNLPTVAVFQTLHFDTSSNAKRLKLFWSAFTGMFIYEVIPAYVSPLLNGFNVFCLASQRASQKTIDVFTNLFGGLIVVIKGQTTLPWWSYIIALIMGSFIAPFSTLLYARMGNGIATNQLMKMVAGAINPGRPVANLYFSMWSHDVISTSIGLAGDLKMGQYLKIPPRVMFLTQRDILLDPRGTNVWSGQVPQSLNSAAVTWSLAKQLYGKDGPYFYSARMSAGVNSTVTSSVIIGLASQLWLRKYHPGWYKQYNYILGGALDGGAQVMIFILSFAVFGASGIMRPFPNWAGNPAEGNMDYCNGNGAFD
ncbi:hypothetical protein C0995_003503 [Termitomyces sp. Mi166|nr:hypothetical protein C0995_003503 [Termitomyces sp. Mi166\